MALTISKLKMWKDPGYTRGCLEVPPAGSKKLPATPDYVLPVSETLRPHKATTLTELHLPISYSQVFDMSYLYIEASDGAGSVKLFGWITGIYQRSTGADGVTIIWDVDYWRSYSGSAVFGKGRMIRTSDSSKRRPSEFHPVLYTPSLVKEISDFYQGTLHQMWCYFRCVRTIGGISNAWLFAFPVGADFGPDGQIPKSGMGLEEIYGGQLDEGLGITSSTITGIWISNIAPDNYPWNSNESHFTTPSADVSGVQYGAFLIDELTQMIYHDTLDLGTTYKSDDLVTYVVTDASGRTIGTLPWGKSFRYIHIQLDIGSVGAYMLLTFTTSATYPTSGTQITGAEGMQIKVPLINVPLTSNAWTDYNFSGQRDNDIEMAKLQNEEAAWRGITGVGTSAVGGAVTGAVTGAAGGPIGAAGGAALGAAVGLASPLINYGIGEVYRDKTQGAVDNYYSKQPNSLLIPSEGPAWYGSSNTAKLIALNADSQSASDYAQMIINDGYNCDCPLDAAGSTAAITSGGPLKIINVNITGSIPPAAKQSIKYMLESGVRIVENNPSGVTP